VQEISVDLAREKGRYWQKQGDNWHFHVLFPECVFNTKSNQYALVMENHTTGQTYVAYSENGFTKFSQELLKLRYGDNILDEERTIAQSKEEPTNPLFIQCAVFTRKNIPWHHHMLFPDCIFNQHPGKWNIILEGKGESRTINMLYDEEPLMDLQQLEIAYFKEKDPTF
jgi:hypothetical protein